MGLSQRSKDVKERVRSLFPAVAVIAVAGLLALGGDDIRQLLRFDRAGLADGELWRLVSGHFVHLGSSHWLLNAAGMVLIALLVAGEFRPFAWLAISVAGIAGIGAGLWFLNPELGWYVGLSGLLHAWLAAGIVGLIANGRPDGWPLAILVIGKLVFEQWSGPLPGSAEAAGGPVVVDAHLYGALAGATAAVLLTRLERRRRL